MGKTIDEILDYYFWVLDKSKEENREHLLLASAEISEVISDRERLSRIDEANKSCEVMRNHSDDIVMAQKVVLDRIAKLSTEGKHEARD